MEFSVRWHSRMLENQTQGQRAVTSYATLKVSTPFLIVCWVIAVWWWSSSLSVVLLSPEEATSAEEDKRSVSRHLLSSGFGAVEEVFRTWKRILQFFAWRR